MITQFGKFCRKLRIDNGELLKNMADRLEVTSSYLSAVENGKRNIPQEWSERISILYSLSGEQIQELEEAIALSQSEIIIKTDNYSDNEKKFLAAFAREFSSLEEEQIEKIQLMFSNHKKG